MATEIERKFRVVGDDWRAAVTDRREFTQGYLCGPKPASVRVRVAGDAGTINVKAGAVGVARAEYEYPIPLADAREMLDSLCVGWLVVKTRHWLEHAGHLWEIDVFAGDNAPLVVAEIELDRADERFERPGWLGEEVTGDVRYYNHALAFHPYGRWP